MYTEGKVYALQFLLFAGLASGCPTWFTNSTGQCECGVRLDGDIICHEDEERIDVLAGYCVTYEHYTKTVLAGYCLYGHTFNMTNRMYSSLPSDPTQLNETTCGPYNREGLLCGHCIKGFGPSVYSYDLQCINCTSISTCRVCHHLLPPPWVFSNHILFLLLLSSFISTLCQAQCWGTSCFVKHGLSK